MWLVWWLCPGKEAIMAADAMSLRYKLCYCRQLSDFLSFICSNLSAVTILPRRQASIHNLFKIVLLGPLCNVSLFRWTIFFCLAALLLTIVQINLRFGTKVEGIWSRLVIFYYKKNSILRTTMLLRLMHCLPWEQIHFSNCMVLFNVFQQMNIDTRYVLTVKPCVLIS